MLRRKFVERSFGSFKHCQYRSSAIDLAAESISRYRYRHRPSPRCRPYGRRHHIARCGQAETFSVHLGLARRLGRLCVGRWEISRPAAEPSRAHRSDGFTRLCTDENVYGCGRLGIDPLEAYAPLIVAPLLRFACRKSASLAGRTGLQTAGSCAR